MADESADMTVEQPAVEAPVVVPKKDDVKVNISGPFSRVINSVNTLRGEVGGGGAPGGVRGGIAKWLSELVNDPNKAGWALETKRVGPVVWEGQPVVGGVVDKTFPMLYPELFKRIQEVAGGGEYRVAMLDDEGKVVGSKSFCINTITDAPKILNTNQQLVAAMGGTAPMQMPRGHLTPYGAMRPTPLTAAAAGFEEDRTLLLRQKEREMTAEATVERQKRELERERRRWDEEDRAEQDRREARAQLPVMQAQEAVRNMERKLVETQQKEQGQMAQMFAMMMQQQQQNTQMLVSILAQPKKDDTIVLLVESMKMQSQQFQTMMQATMAQANAKQHDMIEAAKISAESQARVFEMMSKQNQSSGRFDRLMEVVVTKNLNSGGDSVKQAIELLNTGRQQALDMLEMRESMAGPADDLEYDPDAGVLGNLGRMVFGILKNIGKGGGGLAALPALLGALNKTDPAQITNQDYVKLAQQLETRLPQYAAQQGAAPVPAQLPVAQNPMLPAPVARPAPFDPASILSRPAQRPAQQPVQVPVPVSAPMPVAPVARPAHSNNVVPITAGPGIAEVFEEELAEDLTVAAAPVVSAPALVPAVAVAAEDTPEERLRQWVTAAMNIALTEDIADGRNEHEWPATAIAKWNRQFLDQLAAAPDDGVRVQLIAGYCEPSVFQALQTKLLDQAQPHNYRNFIVALHELVAEHNSARAQVA